MGSHGDLPPPPSASRARREDNGVHVLVAGAGPFHNYTVNPSWLIAQALPKVLAPASAAPVYIHTLPEPWRVSYAWIRQFVPPLLFSAAPDPARTSLRPLGGGGGGSGSAPSQSPLNHPPPDDDHPTDEPPATAPNFDLVLFIGMAVGRDYYTLETRAHRDGYKYLDVDGAAGHGQGRWFRERGGPRVIRSGFDCADVLERWQRDVTDLDVRASDDPGRYCCDYIYYTGLLEYWRRRPTTAGAAARPADRPVMFLHVPAEADAAHVARGARAAAALVRALVENWRSGRSGPGDEPIDDDDAGEEAAEEDARGEGADVGDGAAAAAGGDGAAPRGGAESGDGGDANRRGP